MLTKAIHATAVLIPAVLIPATWVDDDGLCGDGEEEHGEELEHDLDAEEGEGEERGEGLVRLALLHAHLRRVQLRAVREVLVVVVGGVPRVGEAVSGEGAGAGGGGGEGEGEGFPMRRSRKCTRPSF